MPRTWPTCIYFGSWRRGPSRRFFFRFAFDLVGAFEGAGGSVGC